MLSWAIQTIAPRERSRVDDAAFSPRIRFHEAVLDWRNRNGRRDLFCLA
jgi:hypothetical protein